MIYADTSFLAALYLANRTDSKPAVGYAAAHSLRLPVLFLHWPELAWAVWGSQAKDPKGIWDKIKSDLSEARKLILTPSDADAVGQRAAGLMRHYSRRWPRLRSLDVMHVSAAVQCRARGFLSFDTQSDQRILAHTQKLKVWPELTAEENTRVTA